MEYRRPQSDTYIVSWAIYKENLKKIKVAKITLQAF